MKKILFSVLLIASPLLAMAEVGVSITIGDPNYYGLLQLGGYPRPNLLYSQPVIINPVPSGVAYAPVYLRVPPGHYKNWRHYCGRYSACGRPVYFVTDTWYRDVYAPRYYHDHPKKGHGWGPPDRRYYDRGDRSDRGGHRDRDGKHDNGRHGGHGNHRGHD